jgi:hypothetical protein
MSAMVARVVVVFDGNNWKGFPIYFDPTGEVMAQEIPSDSDWLLSSLSMAVSPLDSCEVANELRPEAQSQ